MKYAKLLDALNVNFGTSGSGWKKVDIVTCKIRGEGGVKIENFQLEWDFFNPFLFQMQFFSNFL